VIWPVTAVNAKVGDIVTKDTVLATADSTSAALAVRLATANLAAAKTQKATDLAGGTSTTKANAYAQVTSAKTQLSNAQASYSSTVAQNALSIKKAKASVTQAKAQYTADLKAKAPSQTLSQDRTNITNARDNLTQAYLQVASSNRQAANQITSARQSLATAKRTYSSSTAKATSAILVADDVAIANAQTALETAATALAAATLTAPIDGRVTAVNVAVGDDASGTAIELQSTQLALSVSVSEDDILSLKVGQAASVAISATGTTASGTVTSVNPIAATSGSSSVVTYTVVVTLDDKAATSSAPTGSTPSAATNATTVSATASPAASSTTTAAPLPGMSAEITIVIAQADNAVAVPAIALSGTSGSYVVRVLNSDGTVESRSVQVGLITSSLAQITSGVTSGETVVTGTSADKTSTSSSSSSSNSRTGGLNDISGAGGQPQPPNGAFPGGQP
jgi:macrolide-specific efflux system membrane fusion protein